MAASKALLFGIFVFLVSVTNVVSLRCHLCSMCNDPFDKNASKIVTCPGGSCIKAKYGGNVARTCSVLLFGDDLVLGDICTESDDAAVCSCTTHLCNSASGIGVSFPVACLSTIALFLWMY